MGPSRCAAALAALGAVTCALAACDVVLGLNDFHVRDCRAEHCDASIAVEGGDDARADRDAGEAGADGTADSGPDAADASDASDATDAPLDGDADVVVTDAPPDIAPPTVSQIWAHWPMPNPDAAIAPGSDASLPNPMAYTADDAGLTVYDEVTHLTWQESAGPAATYAEAEQACLSLASAGSSPWRVPTRIELVSLIDFTRMPTINADAFALAADAAPGSAVGTYWTSSLAPTPAGPPLPQDADLTTSAHWVVSFGDGTVTPGFASWVRCVAGGS